MSVPYRNVSQVKLNIKQILDNLQQLSRSNILEEDLQQLQTNTEDLFKNLEEFPFDNLKTKLKLRQKRRRNKKLHKIKKLRNDNIPISDTNATTSVICSPVSREGPTNKHYSNKSIKECQRFLQTFELLEQLHLLRGQNSSETYKFALKLRQLKSIWNSLLQDKLQEQTSTEVNIQQQWNEVLFGPSEKIYFHEKPDLQAFIRKRLTWDSYIDNKYGTSIPIGWIIPDTKVNEQWRPYIAPQND